MVVYVVDQKRAEDTGTVRSQAFGAECPWQVTDPEAAGATTRARKEMHIAKGFPAHWRLAASGTRSGCNAHVAAVFVHCAFRKKARRRGNDLASG